MTKSISTILAVCNPEGDVESIREITDLAGSSNVDAIVVLGNLAAPGSSPKEYGAILKTLGESQLWTFYVPGPADAPFQEFFRQAANFEIVFPKLRCVHSTFALASGPTLFAGMGGVVEDDPKTARDETTMFRYAGWEVEYRLKFLQDLKDYPKVLLFTSVPEHKGMHSSGSSTLAELVKTHNPQFVIVGGEEPKHGVIGSKSHVVAPGSIRKGRCALVNLRKHEATSESFNHVRAA